MRSGNSGLEPPNASRRLGYSSRRRYRAVVPILAVAVAFAGIVALVGASFGASSVPEPDPAPPWSALSCPPSEIAMMLFEVVPGPGDPIPPGEALSLFLIRTNSAAESSDFEVNPQDGTHYQYVQKRDGATEMVVDVRQIGKSWAVTGVYGCVQKQGPSS